MSKEWLEEIENELERSNRAAKNGNTIGAEQMVLDLHEIGSFERLVKYSKKQTKRVQELEEDCEYLSHHYGLEAEQNKRYREAIIKALHGLKTLPSVAPRLYLISILDKALEGVE